MREAAGRDRIARQYVTGFDDVFGIGLPALDAALSRGESGMWPTVFAYMAFLAGFPDSHVARKHGDEIAEPGAARKPSPCKPRSMPPTTRRRASVCLWSSTGG